MTEGALRPARAAAALTPDRLDRPFDDPLFERLFPPLPTGVHWGLERVRAALRELGDPQLRAPALHIGGTNGKGSVASTCASILNATERRVGLYTSPHLCSVRERFQVGGRPLSEAELIGHADDIRTVVAAHGLTFFEAATVLALHAFAREGVEVQVVEVGLGGRLDATNVLEPVACALTNVALDHADFLGDSLEDIAFEKAGIIKPGVPVVTAETGPATLAVFRHRAESLGAPLLVLDPTREVSDLTVSRSGTRFALQSRAYGALPLTTPLPGAHQAVNAALAAELVGLLPQDLRPARDAVEIGVAGVDWPGRDQIEVIDGVTWVFDVAHNTAGVASLVSLLDRLPLPAPRAAVLGVLGDKDWQAMLPPILARVDGAWLTQPPSAPETRRWDPAEALGSLSALGPEAICPLSLDPDFGRALGSAAKGAPGGTVIVTGSCHTVGDALRALDRVPFDETTV